MTRLKSAYGVIGVPVEALSRGHFPGESDWPCRDHLCRIRDGKVSRMVFNAAAWD
jgi:hypothetical protein